MEIENMKQYFDVLDKREKEVIVYRYGLNNYPTMTQKKIAKRLNISRSYVSRIEKRALMKIFREYYRMERHRFQSYLFIDFTNSMIKRVEFFAAVSRKSSKEMFASLPAMSDNARIMTKGVPY